MAGEKVGQPNAGPWMSWDGPWKGSKPVWRQRGRGQRDCGTVWAVESSSEQETY